jgi:hypothetical protein
LISPCWHEPSTERGHPTLFARQLNPVRAGWVSGRGDARSSG